MKITKVIPGINIISTKSSAGGVSVSRNTKLLLDTPYLCNDTTRPIHFFLIIAKYRKERSKRPHQSKRPGALKIAKNGANAPECLDFCWIEKRPGAFFFALFREEGPVGRDHNTRCAKRTCWPSGKGRFAACSGRNGTGIFVFLTIYSSNQTSGLNTTRPTFFPLWKSPGRRLLPYFLFLI